MENHKQYITEILSKNDPNLAKRAIFEFSQKKLNRYFLSTTDTRLQANHYQILMNGFL